MRSFHAYCLSLYCCSLWRLHCPALCSLGVAFNQVIRSKNMASSSKLSHCDCSTLCLTDLVNFFVCWNRFVPVGEDAIGRINSLVLCAMQMISRSLLPVLVLFKRCWRTVKTSLSRMVFILMPLKRNRSVLGVHLNQIIHVFGFVVKPYL